MKKAKQFAAGVTDFMGPLKGFSFVALEAHVERAANAVAALSNLQEYSRDVGFLSDRKQRVSGFTPDAKLNRSFLFGLHQASWCVLLRTAHWVTVSDFAAIEEQACVLSARLKSRTVAVGGADESVASLYNCGELKAQFSTPDEHDDFMNLFSDLEITMPPVHIVSFDGRPELFVEPKYAKSIERVDAATFGIIGSA